jgi:uncharacterized PurR-regulated membrane protein YhhQ (DUF165 family)
MHGNQVYQIIFEEIPKKFFATTISFAVSFYLPHLLCCSKSSQMLSSPRRCVLLAVFGGLVFFCSDFYFLFSGPHAHSFKHIFIDSFMIASLLLLILGVLYLSFLLENHSVKQKERELNKALETPAYHYCVCFAVIVMLICLACEYRIVAFGKEQILTASCLFFPIIMAISTVMCEVWGYQAHFRLIAILIAAQLIFDALLMAIVALPSPNYFDLSPFYNYIVPRRLPAASLSLLVSFLSNGLILRYFQSKGRRLQRLLRILIANTVASTLLCLIDYSLLFGGIYPYEQVVNLAVHVWYYKLISSILTLPVILYLCRHLQQGGTLRSSRRFQSYDAKVVRIGSE